MSAPRLRSKPITQDNFASEDAFQDLDLWIQSLGPHTTLRLSPAQIKDIIRQLHDSPLRDLISFLSHSLGGRRSAHEFPRRYPSLRHTEQLEPPLRSEPTSAVSVQSSMTLRRRAIAVYLALLRALSNKERTRLDVISRVAGSLNILDVEAASSPGSLRSRITDDTKFAPPKPGK